MLTCAPVREISTLNLVSASVRSNRARAMKEDREACLAAGMDGYIPKPIQSKKLLQLIAELTGAASPTADGGNRELAGELAIRERDPDRVQFAAHAFRGSAASLSATQVATSAVALEAPEELFKGLDAAL
jgi:DNA-binding response OmpR family regulator